MHNKDKDKDKVWDPVLIKLARLSPPKFALTIMRRNRKLLMRLNMLEKYAGRGIADIPSLKRIRIEAVSAYGCPHCKGPFNHCGWCMWVKAGACFKFDQVPCACIRFPSGKSLGQMYSGHRVVAVVYNRWHERIRLGTYDSSVGMVTAKALASAKAFVQDHIDWAELKCWGEDYKKKKKEEHE